jgi:hypothetical protein
MTEEVQIIETSTGVEVFEAQERAAIDSQVATAKRYPRDLVRVRNNSIAIACMDKETAESCRYAKPVGGKNVTGASVHLARIICQQYGNIRVQQRIKQITDKVIIAEAVAFDMETNYAVSVEARRSIVGKDGQRYKESVIETNAMAILAVAERNAILKVIPKAISDSVYKAAFDMANGDLSDADKITIARKKALDFFKETYSVAEEQVLQVLGLRSVNQIGKEQIADLRGYIQSIKDGELTISDLFGKTTSAESAQKAADIITGATNNTK